MEGVSAIAAFASAFAGLRPALSNLYVVNTLVTRLIANSISSLQSLDSSYCSTYNPSSLGKEKASSWMENADMLAKYTKDVQDKAIEFMRMSHDELAAAHLKSSLAGMETAAQTIASAFQEDGPLISFLNSCQAANNSQCQMSACYAVSLMKHEIMAYILALWANNANSDAETYKLLDSVSSNVTQRSSRIEYGAVAWQTESPLASTYIADGEYLYAIIFYADSQHQRMKTCRAHIYGPNARPIECYSNDIVTFNPAVKPSMVCLDGIVYLLYLGQDGLLYFWVKEITSDLWGQNVVWNPTTYFPGFSATNAFSISILQLATAGSNLYLIGVSPIAQGGGVLVHKIDYNVPSLAGTGLGDLSWAYPQYYTSFQALDVGGDLYIFGRGAYGIQICRLNINPQDKRLMIINTVREFNNTVFPQRWNDASQYASIKIIYANGNLIFCGRQAEGVFTVVYKQFLTHPYGPSLYIGPLDRFADNFYGQHPVYQTFTTYVGNNAFLDGFISYSSYCGYYDCAWQSCELINYVSDPSQAWNCNTKGVSPQDQADINSVGLAVLKVGNALLRYVHAIIMTPQGNILYNYPDLDSIILT